ncbi:uncharacterized protein LOC119683412, partial [Teleopsis dalmanni]|uniref:uncharacterized protein LOC119683412 n=1 Tax=Teleopsis dalmanni TaxID=139649 RepID=UPI0018CFE3D7
TDVKCERTVSEAVETLVSKCLISMLGFVYLVLILGWILIVLFLKCKKTITPHFAFTDNYTDAIGTGRRPSIHVIQLQSDDIESENRLMDSYHQNSQSLRRHSHRSQRSTIEERTIETATYPTDAVINPAYTHDEEYIINAPPPSYEEVMRQPEVYPKVHQTSKSSEANI